MSLTKEKLAQNFIEAGEGFADINPDDLIVVGVKKTPKQFKSKNGRTLMLNNWESFCAYVYEQITDEAHPGVRLRGRGFRSRAFGQDVAKAIRALDTEEK